MNKVALMAANERYVCADLANPDKLLVADRTEVRGWETFEMVELGESRIALRAANDRYVCADVGRSDKRLVADREGVSGWESFVLVKLGDGKIALRAANEQYVCADLGRDDKRLAADRESIGGWETFTLLLADDLKDGGLSRTVVEGWEEGDSVRSDDATADPEQMNHEVEDEIDPESLEEG